MSSIVQSTIRVAHNVATSWLAHDEIKPNGKIPAVEVKEDHPDKTEPLKLVGKNLLIGVPGAFTTPCNSHINPYIENYQEFKAKGIKHIYIVAVNDAFVMKAWKQHLAPDGTPIHFIADDKAALVSALGLVFDATELLGGPRSKRFAIVTDDDRVVSVAVEQEAPSVTVTSAKSVLASL